jgi:outer membrane cobalamin receptor
VYPEVWGDAFKKMYRPYIINSYADLLIPFGEKLNLQGSIQLAFQNDFNLQWSPSVRLNIKPSTKHEIDLAAYRLIRFPNINERYFDFDSLYGNPDVQPEEHVSFSARYQFNASSDWRFGGTIGYSLVDKEIQWNSLQFENSDFRDFTYAALKATYSIWQIDFSLGGHYTISDNHFTPRSSIWGSAHFYHQLIKGALKLDAYGTLYYYDTHDKVNFESRLMRFYRARGENDGYYTLNWKVAATLSGAQVFFEMDNALSRQYEVVNGYPEFYYRFRFGINWELWD